MIIQYLKYVCSISAGLDIKKIERCMGDPNADSENPVLKEEQDAQVLLYFINQFFILCYHLIGCTSDCYIQIFNKLVFVGW